jgi:hypothetical protein
MTTASAGLIMARCPELTEADLAQLAAPDPDDRLSASIGEQILDVFSGRDLHRLVNEYELV